jgi:hypothetical protein
MTWKRITETEPKEGELVVFAWSRSLDDASVGWRSWQQDEDASGDGQWLYSSDISSDDGYTLFPPSWYLTLPEIP